MYKILILLIFTGCGQDDQSKALHQYNKFAHKVGKDRMKNLTEGRGIDPEFDIYVDRSEQIVNINIDFPITFCNTSSDAAGMCVFYWNGQIEIIINKDSWI